LFHSAIIAVSAEFLSKSSGIEIIFTLTLKKSGFYPLFPLSLSQVLRITTFIAN